MASKGTFEDLDLSKDEVKRLSEALKDETFRKMLCEYAEEISDPENKRKAEEEIAMMEAERGMNVEFIHPQPGYVMKTTVDGTTKAFINICQNDKIDKPKSKRETGPDGKSGMMWQIPHSFAPPKDDTDKSNNKCKTFDVVFNPDTFRMAESNARFKNLVENTAIEGIEKQFNVTLDKKNIKYPKMKFKGIPTATIIREKKGGETKKREPSIIDKMPYPYSSKDSSEQAKENEKKASNKKMEEIKPITEPKYSITHRSELDMAEYRNAPDSKTSTRPKALVVKVELPLLTSATQVSLDIFEKRLTLESISPAKYKLDLSLPFPVNEDEGSAKFDKAKRTLTVTLPVLAVKAPLLPFGQNGHDQNGSENPLNDNAPTDIAPLIEVIPDSEFSSEKSHISEKQNSVDRNDNKHFTNKFPDNVKWCSPDFQFSQDNETISFVIKVQSVQEEMIQIHFQSENVAVIQFMSMGTGCFPSYYSMWIEFPTGCFISSDHYTIDTSYDNLVFVILKEKDSRGIWDSFKVGVDDTNLETKQFLTECNLRQQLSTLAEDASRELSMPVQEGTNPELTVSEMNNKRLTIDIKPRKSKKKNAEENEDDFVETPNSADIKVIHKHPLPFLHGILKQRTVSESSEDFQFEDPSSPRSGDDADPLSSSSSSFKRRSVSFNSYVDRTSFKSGQSPSSMTTALKSKRRRQRKRDMRINGRTRSTSEGTSEGSSCEFTHSEGEAESEPEVDKSNVRVSEAVNIPESKNNKKNKKKNRKSKKVAQETGSSDQDDQITSQDAGDGLNSGVLISEEKSSSADSESEKGAGEGNGLDFRTKSEEVINSEDSAKSESAEPAKDKSENLSDVEKNHKIVSEIKSKMAGTGCGDGVGDKVDSDDDAGDESVCENKTGCSDDLTGCDVQGEGDRPSDQTDLKHQTDVETMLRWDDPLKQDGGNEHATVCAVKLENSVMFDLDVD